MRRGPRSSLAITALSVTASLGLVALGCGRAQEAAAPDPVRLDERIASLLEPCVNDQFYDRDTSDMVPVMIEKLAKGSGEPLKRAKEELGEGGEEAAEALRRFFDKHYASAFEAPLIENALDAASLNRTLTAHDVLVRALDHPMESVRQHALSGMIAGRARPEDFELFLARIDSQPGQLQRMIVRAMFVADAARAEETCLGWIAAGERQGVWMEACQSIAKSVGERTPELCADLFEGLEPIFAYWIAAPAARAGDEAALAFERAGLERTDPNLRITTVRALTVAGLGEELVGTLRDDLDDQVRVLALDGIATTGEHTRERRDWIAEALDDPAPAVRGLALKHLCEWGDAEALERALVQLSAESKLLQEALLALAVPVQRDPELARRMYERLLERHAGEMHRPVQQRTATYKAMGLVPLPEAAEFLRQVGVENDGEIIEGLRAHDWLMIQAANSGPPGRRQLFEDLGAEEDPLRRLDIISALGSARDDAAREMLMALIDGGARTPVEKLLTASRLVKLGPAAVVAPRLKRLSYEIEDRQVRIAMQCLLWSWY